MRGHAVVFVGGVSFALGTALVACFDLFHSTADVLSACELDAGAPGCIADAGTNFCDWTPSEARLRAEHACSWLGACETPMGGNAFGPCMFHALLAYDCEANPNHRAKGKAQSLWECLSRVKNCADVDACIFPGGPAVCPMAHNTVCGTAKAGAASNADVRFECNNADGLHPHPQGENCALWGKTCAASGSATTCVGSGGPSCATTKGCSGVPRSDLSWCDGGDMGIDCAGNGGRFCLGFVPDAGDSWVACAVESDAESCTPNLSAACANGVAFSCPTGLPEKIECARIFLSDAGCQPGILAPPFDWTSPCAVVPSQCTESCADGGLVGCARGAAFHLDCTGVGLGPCVRVSTDVDTAEHAACTLR